MEKRIGDFYNAKIGTKTVWAGEVSNAYGITQVPLNLGVTYRYDDLDEWFDVGTGRKEGFIYSRNTNPTVRVFEEKMRVLEGAEASTSFSSGMAAISNTLFALLKPGDSVISIKDTYGGTSRIFLEYLPKFNINVKLCETNDQDEIETEIMKGYNIVYLETPTNPTLKVVDIERLTKAAKKTGAIVVVDNTFSTPINSNPIELGVDIVAHSATKFLGGHSDALGGIICGKKELIDRIYAFREINGAALHPMAAYLLLRGMKTLELRILRQNENAMKLARFLDNHEKIETVYYPGLETHINHGVAKKQMRGFGGMLSFTLKGDFETVKSFLTKLIYVNLAAHLGSVECIAGPPRTTSHVELTAEERQKLGIPENLIRYSVGIENIEDILADIDQALNKI